MKRLTPILLLLIMVAGFWLAGRLHQPLLDQRRQYRLDQADPLVNSPPLVAFTSVAMGGFRGIMADLLWLRASKLQDEGKFFELVQLSDWITKLEPRFSQVWAFHAWNLTYNISVLFSDPADRWRWVRHGISLLRDQGLRFNPGDSELYQELGWFFQHKIGAHYDDANMYYKEAWAKEMMDLMDGPRPDYAVWAGQETNSAAYSKMRRLKEEYKLDPALMQEVDDVYGPLDWRMPQAHAIYWAWRGRKFATAYEALAAERMIFQCLAEAFFQGNLFFKPEEKIFIPSPNLDLLPRVLAAFEQARARFPDVNSVRVAHEMFLKQAALVLYTFHRNREARNVFEELASRYPSEDTANGFDAFVYRFSSPSGNRELTHNEALILVQGAIYQCLYWRKLGDPDRAAGFEQTARLYWEQYMAPRTNDPILLKRIGLPPLDKIYEQARSAMSLK